MDLSAAWDAPGGSRLQYLLALDASPLLIDTQSLGIGVLQESWQDCLLSYTAVSLFNSIATHAGEARDLPESQKQKLILFTGCLICLNILTHKKKLIDWLIKIKEGTYTTNDFTFLSNTLVLPMFLET